MSNEPLRDPTAETSGLRRPRQERLPSLDGRSIALLDIGKMRGDEFVARLEQLFAGSGFATRTYRKPTNARVAPVELLQQIARENHAVVLALSD